MAEHVPLDLCDFCVSGSIRWVFLTPEFSVSWGRPAIYPSPTTFAEGGWGACRACAQLVEQDDVGGLVERAVRNVRRSPDRDVPVSATVLRRHFAPIFERVVRLRTARRTPQETSELQGYADQPIGYSWREGQPGVEWIMPNVRTEQPDAEWGE